MSSYRERAEKAFCDMFDFDREFDVKLSKMREATQFKEWLDYPGMAEIAFRLIGLPEDNWGGITQESELEAAENERTLICWDYFYEQWLREAKDAKAMLEICREGIKAYAEREAQRIENEEVQASDN